MKKRLIPICIILALVILCLSACGNVNNRKPDVSQLEFPGIKWGMSPEEVKSALNISEDMIISETNPRGCLEIAVSGLQYFGGETDNVIFRFESLSGGRYALYNVSLYYLAGTDMAMIRDNLIKIYGPGTDYGYTDYDIWDNAISSKIKWVTPEKRKTTTPNASIEDNAKNPKPTDQIEHWWASAGKGVKTFSDEEIEMLVTMFDDGVGTYAERETVMEYLEKVVKVTIRCADTSNLQLPVISFTGSYISFVALADSSVNE